MAEQSTKKGLQLITASEKGDIEAVKSLLDDGAYIHAQDDKGRCAVVAAAYNNRLEVVDLLINAGADVNMKDDTLQSAYLISTSEGYTELLKKTVKAGADVHGTDSYNGTGLIRAADRGHVEIVKELLKTNIRVNHINKIGWTALLEAIILGDGGVRHTKVVRLLADSGADVNLPDKDGVTPLAHAENRNFTDIVGILKNAGAENQPQNRRDTVSEEVRHL
ncbi:MAG: ankyrin repeat domain-containing protein [Oscillospiraceae bacterium]|jgi:ankyrin repeat protein|nr:ankyrin repeat domain-containing protein [Oscillospiraceae bacterium]